MWNESHTHTQTVLTFFFVYKSRNNRRVCLSCLLYIRKGERNSFSRMSWYFRCCPGSCFCFVFLSFPFRLSCGHLQRSGFLKREREQVDVVHVWWPSTVNFFFKKTERRRKKKNSFDFFCVFRVRPLQSAPGVTSSTLSNGADHPPSSPHHRSTGPFWSGA